MRTKNLRFFFYIVEGAYYLSVMSGKFKITEPYSKEWIFMKKLHFRTNGHSDNCFWLSLSEGLFLTCSYDFLTEDWNHKSYCLYAFIANFLFPLVLVIFFYSQIFKAVVVHEAALKAQAKKMNVDSLRSNAVSYTSSKYKLVEKKI